MVRLGKGLSTFLTFWAIQFLILVTLLLLIYNRRETTKFTHPIKTMINGTVNNENGQETKNVTECPRVVTELHELVGYKITSLKASSLEEIETRHPDVTSGGSWSPRDCQPRSRALIIIPFRDRWPHLVRWFENYLPIFKRQKLDFRIVLTEQYGNSTFNKGRIMNAAFTESWKIFHFDCVIFHDVDMLLENDHNLYHCRDLPTHLSPSVSKFGYDTMYDTLIGGVISFPVAAYFKVNGYSNLYWGWGGEDDDMYTRLKQSKLKLQRPPQIIGRYKMIVHKQREWVLFKREMDSLLAGTKSRYRQDGLSNVKYKLVGKKTRKLFTHFTFDIGVWEHEGRTENIKGQ
ncbi:beta-1,4-N-acetylgalactosaminyltransferase bre-4 [Lingula anatina]|uniref:Beta-1,4-galactosyltransferase n=1 Tax=Lingula anatina TaxID=7574 RepID=A0A1S3I291_LINAN|nr:beta-1,4-N-acetylgalactosaminyltransferase bre-4 [Lingula anatina]XP_013392346.1 beta-1,4-N-acetylgalactosaminyltransferase bre-4 [Lingula anatina]XP_013392355.1 beta-1,4-N-acetylgalactosaminyltransferase bre-4 [Lingula anatina]XP_013392364.1 beta-1,4-N-acetylgalactosaminyltransferase bre-4 [Lingula anatina]XP_013392372.1 beta-1,4-N-acetylgalactosaminyltransferase bre-4 [Lingula anatina]XP_013392379.1 beta-1,4-N-acetylgalactosaminyltransferase bre-4 [Lingula anatina]XP_013392387.1 beta-1,4|eukprot:XP_013392336.1 beta-1,4-N-acetylgalactosaminyltransferase bre-4 [Lingula anatina]